ncbi:MAG: phosphoribosylanthranilate isomerase [Canidatus Methanoxibalbensis ujae]|nr:phosphoribosylanthranilate isomerase [Candidatus Methanoxibalbensis ujae]MCW7077704.1 phosphoribosylanthranilate isomerase [Candidatus Methanoxibalbensis ujae]
MRGSRIRVKVCGIRRVEDAFIAVEAGADAIGVIQVEGTRRFISVEDAEKIFNAIPPLITKVVVVMFDGLSDAEIDQRVRDYERIGADCIQLHGNERVEIVKRLREKTSLKLIKKIGIPAQLHASSRDAVIARIIQNANSYEKFVDAILLDTAASTASRTTAQAHLSSHRSSHHSSHRSSHISSEQSPHGGTGVVHDWEISARTVSSLGKPVILAGGLNPENVRLAIMRVRPFAVDVSSGVENASGWKDEEKVRKFVSAALSLSH